MKTYVDNFPPYSRNTSCDLRKKTNADRIRAKNDEELAKWICDLGIDCAYCKITSMCYEVCKNGDCEKAWLEWLKQPVEKGEI